LGRSQQYNRASPAARLVKHLPGRELDNSGGTPSNLNSKGNLTTKLMAHNNKDKKKKGATTRPQETHHLLKTAPKVFFQCFQPHKGGNFLFDRHSPLPHPPSFLFCWGPPNNRVLVLLCPLPGFAKNKGRGGGGFLVFSPVNLLGKFCVAGKNAPPRRGATRTFCPPPAKLGGPHKDGPVGGKGPGPHGPNPTRPQQILVFFWLWVWHNNRGGPRVLGTHVGGGAKTW